MILKRTLFISLFLFLLYGFHQAGFYEVLWSPFTELPEKLRVWPYINYALLMFCFVFFVGIVIIATHQTFYTIKTGDMISPMHSKMYLYLMFISIALGIMALIPRYYLSNKLVDSHYVQCKTESYTSRKSSWNTYAKDLTLCISSAE
ncbi:Protein of unknown function [Vibrio xiamenensis]|uniref:Uncharacterized protein n=1 Tax=Vibrio xiamenensis TaxID=861298 RepID=A0A1G7WB60_9VIBR|nr:Protein of unknown function [Vibrio xiamenensis]